MPTNILRNRGTKVSAKDARSVPKSSATRQVEIKLGKVAIAATLLDTPTADRIWVALPLHSTVETWGAAIHFEVPVESGRGPGAVVKAQRGHLYFWSDEDRVIVAFGATPLSRPGEMRLPVPCNAWAVTDDDLEPLSTIRPGTKVSVSRR